MGAFSIGLRVDSKTTCVFQISRRSLQYFILNDDDAYIASNLHDALDTLSVELEVRALRSLRGERSLR